MTTFYCPLIHKNIWRTKTIVTCMVSCWIASFLFTIAITCIDAKELRFRVLSDGVLVLLSPKIDWVLLITMCFLCSLTVLICATCYTCAIIKYTRMDRQKSSKIVQWKLMISALTSSLGFLVELACLLLLIFFLLVDDDWSKNGLFAIVFEIEYHQCEVSATISVWIHLLLNKNLRKLALEKTYYNVKRRISPNMITLRELFRYTSE
ncbi:hypothetical protein Q1695_007031 [Nippostrongylus brasiliensis]|nr:hypothetical protein Q1695_007031 [Nippostrongylus brasiliensis]